MHGLVMPYLHAQQCTDASANDCQSQQGSFLDSPLGAFGFPLVDAIREEGDDINGDKIDEYELFDCHSFVLLLQPNYITPPRGGVLVSVLSFALIHFLMYLVHVADFLQHGGAPGIIARYLDAAVTCGRRGEDGRTVVIKHHGAALGQREESVALHSVDDGQQVPHLLAGVAVAGHIDLFDGVIVGP